MYVQIFSHLIRDYWIVISSLSVCTQHNVTCAIYQRHFYASAQSDSSIYHSKSALIKLRYFQPKSSVWWMKSCSWFESRLKVFSSSRNSCWWRNLVWKKNSKLRAKLKPAAMNMTTMVCNHGSLCRISHWMLNCDFLPLPDFPWSKQLAEMQKSIFYIERLRPLQLRTMNLTMSGKDCLLIMPTGGGKSLCFQLPAMVSSGTLLHVLILWYSTPSL